MCPNPQTTFSGASLLEQANCSGRCAPREVEIELSASVADIRIPSIACWHFGEMTPVSGDLDLFGLPAGGSKFDDLPNEAEPAYLTLRVPCLQCQATSLQVD